MSKLTPKQHDVLERLIAAGGRSSYDLRATLGTLCALERRGLVSARRGLGSIAMPRTSIKWMVTKAGRAALAVSQSTPTESKT